MYYLLDAMFWVQHVPVLGKPWVRAGSPTPRVRLISSIVTAFLVPCIERLYRAKFDADMGLGALIISPTRELALQIFEVLRVVGKKHSMSAGLVIGGKNFKEEQHGIVRMNLLVCTPGRLLQHLQQTAAFEYYGLEVCVSFAVSQKKRYRSFLLTVLPKLCRCLC